MANVLPGGSNGFYAGQPTTSGSGAGFYSSATQPVASAAPITSSGANPNTGAYYTGIQKSPTPGTAPTGGATLAPNPNAGGNNTPYDPNHPTVGYTDPTTGNVIGYNPNAPFYAGNGTFGALGTDAPTGGIGNTSGASAASMPAAPGTGTTGTGAGSGGVTASDSGFLSGPGYAETNFATHGNDLNGPSQSSQLYDEGVSATNPFYQNAMDQAAKGINSAESMRGGGNSGAALEEIAMTDANLLGQQALAQGQLAGQADTADTSRFTATANAATGAENATNARGNSAAAAYTGLSNSQANTVDNFFQMAQTGQLTGDMASIEAQLAASGIDAATAQAITNDLLTVAGIGVKAAGSK